MTRKYKNPCSHVGCTKKIRNEATFCREHASDARKIPIKRILKELEGRGFRAINITEYEGNDKPFGIVCPNGHRTKISWANLRVGKGCGVCAGKSHKHQQAVVSQSLQEKGYTALAPYVNARTGFLCRCPKGHEILVQWQSFRNGVGCRLCAGKWKDEEIAERLKQDNCQIVSIQHGDVITIEFKCPKRHLYKMPLAAYLKGRECGYCSGFRLDANEVTSFIEKEGYKLLDEFKNNYTKMDLQCPKGHIFKSNWDIFRSGSRCPTCAWAGFKPLAPASLYYLEINHDGELLYKIGVTNRTVEERFVCAKVEYKILMDKKFLFGYLAKEEERRILEKFKKYKLNDPSIKINGGHSEIFDRDILSLSTTKAA
jgi:hypothetical protein